MMFRNVTGDGMAATSNKAQVHIRWAIRRDMPEVEGFEGKMPIPMHEKERLAKLRQRNCIGMVAEIEERVVGFMLYELHSKRIELIRFSVDPEFQHRGVATAMMRKLKDKLSPIRRNRIGFLLPESCLDLLRFLKHHGFVAQTPLEKGHFGDLDGILMLYEERNSEKPEDSND